MLNRKAKGKLTLLSTLLFLSACVPGSNERIGEAMPPHPAPRTSVEFSAIIQPNKEVMVGTATQLTPFLNRLSKLDAGKPERLTILQLGDSHTAGGIISEHLRRLLQDRFGGAGRGMMVAGHAYSGLRQTDIRITQSGKWNFVNSLKSGTPGPFGISGFRATSRKAGSSMTLNSQEDAGFDRVVVEYVRRPGNGYLDIEVDGRRISHLSTNGSRTEVLTMSAAVPTGSRQLRLMAPGKEPVELLSWTIERSTPGIIYDSHGVSGATVEIISRWDEEVVTKELRSRSPSLVILAYGTNEGFGAGFDAARYEAIFRDTVKRIRATLPEAAILVMGAPDAARMPEKNCKKRNDALILPCVQPGSQISPRQCIWSPPSPLAEVREIQRRVSANEGAYFWNWEALMGGACGIHRWALANPPLARSDHVHLNLLGYTAVAESLYQTIMEAYRNHDAAVSGIPARRG
jgi:lysophospholipase L1-like esterase